MQPQHREPRRLSLGDLIVFAFISAALYIGATMWIDSYREHHAAEVVAQALSSPAVMNSQLDSIEAQTRQLCIAQGYSESECKKMLGN